MMQRFEEERFSRNTSKWGKRIGIPLAVLLSAGIVWEARNYFLNQDRRLQEAFSGSCGTETVEVIGDPRAFAKLQLERLRREYPGRFDTISAEDGIQKLGESYNPNKRTLEVPKYDCNSK